MKIPVLFAALMALIWPSDIPVKNTKSDIEFKILGATLKVADHTMLFLDDLSSYPGPTTIDSASVINNAFQFSGIVKDSLTKMMVRTRDNKSFKLFWVENSTVRIKVKGTNLQLAKVEGSESQKEQDRLDSLLDAVNQRNSSSPIEKERLEKQKYEATLAFVKRHRKSIMGVSVVLSYAESMSGQNTKDPFGRTKFMNLYDVLSDKSLDSNLGQQLTQNYVLTSNKVRIGDRYADFKQPDVNGDTIKLSDVHSNLILLEFWSSGCGACRLQNPELVRTYSRFKSKGFEIVAVSLDRKKDAWIKAIEHDQLNWIHVSDLKEMKNEAVKKYGVLAMPYNFLIDRNGIVIDRGLNVYELNARLEELLQ